MKEIKKLLVANRGEIAVRIFRTCREMGIKTVAVYSEVDRQALHVAMADEAYLIGPALSAESYLKVENLIGVAKKCGADAIHPGYGFLSEKEFFSAACEKAGLIFIGPDAKAIASMGDKITARAIAEKAGVPVVPGSREPLKNISEAKIFAEKHGYPILLKATAGGGGKGMRTVSDESEIASAFEMATREAEKAFSDGRLYIEKKIVGPRHVEIQVACDTHGNGIFLLERECSMQRRHQKVIEEAPCFYLRDDVRAKMADAALKLAKAVNYVGVGTVECLLDAEQNFYFLEMNTRLQVEHTVSEMITGIDFVRLQIDIANGANISKLAGKISGRGHAIECRIYAEDPASGFMPSPGKINFFKAPEGPGIRHDAGVYSGAEIPIYYDPMISKLVVHAETREQAISRMLRALKEMVIAGPRNNIIFLKKLIADPVFVEGKGHTQYLDQHPEIAEGSGAAAPGPKDVAAALFQFLSSSKNLDVATNTAEAAERSPWRFNGQNEMLNSRF